MTREEKQKAKDALKISAPIMAVTQEEFKDYIQTLNIIMDWLEQEPTSKNNLALIHTEGLDEEIRCTMCTNSMKSDRGCDGSCVVNKDMYKAVMDAIERRIQPTTKNNLGVDCIDRAELLKAMDTWDKFGYTSRYGLERLDKDDKGFVPYVKYEDMVNCVKGMPSVTPIRPKGHWINTDATHSKCNRCGALFEIASANGEANYCPNCGADMREVEK